jgi:hypothetical protein
VKDTFVEVITRDPLHSLEAGERFMAVLEKTTPDWLPGKWGHWEPLRRDYTPTDLEEAWSDDPLLWKGRGAKIDGYLSKPHGPHRRYGLIHFSLELPPADEDRATHAAQDLALTFDAVYGFVHINTRHGEGEEPNLLVSQFDLRGGLERFYWGNVLGSPFVDLYGPKRIASAPAYAVEQLGPELFWVQLTERLDDVRVDPDDVADVAAAVKEHLGAGVPEELAAMSAPGDTLP